MNVLEVLQRNKEGSIVFGASSTRVSGSWLVIARVGWLVLVLVNLGFLIAGFPVFYQQLQTACVGPVACNIFGALPAEGLRMLPALGLSPVSYAALLTIFYALIVTVWSGTGFLIFWRRSDDWLALLAAFLLVMFNTTYPGTPTSVLTMVHPNLIVPITFIGFLGQISLVLFFLVFPDGRFVPRWVVLVMLPSIIQIVAFVLPATIPFSESNWPAWLDGPINAASYAIVIFSQVYRYIRVSTPAQRQQTKWVVFAIVTITTAFLIFAPLFSALGVDQGNTPYAIFVQLSYPLFFLLLPVCSCIAILRYRLYDIDTVINRTLVYGLLTSILAAIYFGLIFGLQFLLQGIVHSNNDVAIVISTLAIAALFQPLRVRIQRIIDRRFYRRKYDAARTLAAFNDTLRSEVDLSQLSEQLVIVVTETMQPSHVSLWLRKRQDLTPH